jgi:hypothetical protein
MRMMSMHTDMANARPNTLIKENVLYLRIFLQPILK